MQFNKSRIFQVFKLSRKKRVLILKLIILVLISFSNSLALDQKFTSICPSRHRRLSFFYVLGFSHRFRNFFKLILPTDKQKKKVSTNILP